jgi:Ca-activated chloride channel family protein
LKKFFAILTALTALGAVPSGQAPQDTKSPRFSAEVEQVVVYASVYDEQGHLVPGLTKDDFTVLEDKVPQTLTSFQRTEVPSTIGIVLDSSGSMRSKMPTVEKAIDLFLSHNNPDNELFFIRFDDQATLEEDFTKDVDDIRDAISNVVVKGGTALYDAIYLAVNKAREGSEPKKVVVVFTDGEDKDSFYKPEELLQKVQEMDTQVFIVAFLDKDLSDDKGFFGLFKSQRAKVEDEIHQIAEITGGKAFFPEAVDELGPAFESIAFELKNQYQLAYISSQTAHDGAWRRIDVKIKDAQKRGLKVRFKKGYYAPKDS